MSNEYSIGTEGEPMTSFRAHAILLTTCTVLAGTAAAAQEPTAQETPTSAAEMQPTTSATAPPAAEGTTPPATTPAAETKVPKLHVAELVKEIGRIQRGERAEVVFELENQGEGPLQIKSAQPSCGCTVASFDKEIAPGAKGTLRATLDTSNLEGALSKSVTVISNDPAQPRVVLTIRLEVVSYVRVSPSFARLLQVQSMPPAATAVNLWTEDGTALELGAIETGAEWVEARARRAEASERRDGGPAEQWRLEVTLRPEAPLGPLTQTVVVATNHPKQPKVEVPLSGFVRPVLSAQPAAADFGSLGPRADPKQFVLKLFNFGGEPVEVRSATTDLDFVTVTIEPDDPGRRFRIRLVVGADAPKGKFEGTLRIETSSGVMPTVEVPVRGKIQ
ncbi:MAG TPA: DUF1573 domain-containing protein [Thermoanaerobaculia bacterium]|nr:DUF1573 domain-containing protein [Thermoanaerobaculia bacterium]